MVSTMPLTSLLPSLALVCPSNWGSGTLILRTLGQALADILSRQVLFDVLE